MPIESCKGCPLYETGKGFCPDQEVSDPQYTIYGEAPGANEIQLKKPFQGKAGFVLKNWLLKVVPKLAIAEDRNKISYKNILHCLPPQKNGRPYPTGKERVEAEAHCAQYRNPSTDAKIVILCGEVPQRLFFKEELEAEDQSDKRLGRDLKGVMGRVGREYEKGGRRYIFSPHPSFILRNPAYVAHGQRAMEIAEGEAKVLSPDYLPWEMGVEQIS